jgi:hypothetical protein
MGLRESDRISDVMSKPDLKYEDFSGFVSKTNSAPLQAALQSIGTVIPAFK